MKDKLCHLLGISWIVSTGEDSGELGLKIGPAQFWYYKWTEPMILFSRPYRIARKREFGTVVKSVLE